MNKGVGIIKDNSRLKNGFEILPLLITLAGNTMAVAGSAAVNIHHQTWRRFLFGGDGDDDDGGGDDGDDDDYGGAGHQHPS